MTLAVLGHQPYSEVCQMDQRELDTLFSVVKEINDTRSGGARRTRRR